MGDKVSTASRVEEFLNSFQVNGKYEYKDRLSNLAAKGGRSIVVDFEHLTQFDTDIAVTLLLEPRKTIPDFQAGARTVLSSVSPEYAGSLRSASPMQGLQVRFKGVTQEVNLRDVRVDHLGKLISLQGIILRVSEVRAQPVDAVFVCGNGHITRVLQDDPSKLKRPEKCEACDESRNLEFDRQKTEYVDIQNMKIQELPEELPPGQIPQSYDVIVTHDMINAVRPGDRVTLTGIPESFPETNPSMGRGTFKIQVTCNYVEIIGKGPEQMEISKEEEEKIKSLASSPGIYQDLVRSVAPAIMGNDIQKEAILLSLVGSQSIVLPDETRIRGNINILMVGDPGIAKSQMLKFASQASPRGLYASGRMSTAAGLTAAVVKDKNNLMSLEAGVVVLADQGLAAIDEFEKLDANDRSALHEQMESQCVTIAKGGFYAILNARTAIIAAANPTLGMYNPYKEFLENISLPPPLLTRFDLIYVMRDQVSAEEDLKLARHILEIHTTSDFAEEPPIDVHLLKKYIAYSKRLSPILTPEAKEKLEEYYLRLRRTTAENQIPATPRSLESLIRLATARARLMHREQVLREDADAAMRLMDLMLETVLVDASTGRKGDFGAILGLPASQVNRLSRALDVFKALETSSQSRSVQSDVFNAELQKALGIDEAEARKVAGVLEREGRIWQPRQGTYRSIG